MSTSSSEHHLPEPPMRPEGASITNLHRLKDWGSGRLRSLVPVIFLLALVSPIGALVVLNNLLDWLELALAFRYSWIILAGLAAGCGFVAHRAFRLKHQVDITPTSRIRSLAMGLVEVQGTSRRLYSLTSPLTGRPCAYYRLRKYRYGILEYETDSSHVPFCLEDETGRVAIDPASARIAPSRRRYGVATEEGPLQWTEDIYEPEYYVEDILFEGVELYVLGYAVPFRLKETTGLSQRVREALFRLKKNKRELMTYDQDGDGKISLAEWDEARRRTEEQMLHELLADQAPNARQENFAIITNPRKRWLPFIIAENQSDLDVHFRYQVVAITFLLMAVTLVIWSLCKL